MNDLKVSCYLADRRNGCRRRPYQRGVILQILATEQPEIPGSNRFKRFLWFGLRLLARPGERVL